MEHAPGLPEEWDSMKSNQPSLTSCRICGGPTTPANADYPFCGERCRERDLGNWATESYRVAAVITDEEDLHDSGAVHARQLAEMPAETDDV